jgi:hypothetical protein
MEESVSSAPTKFLVKTLQRDGNLLKEKLEIFCGAGIFAGQNYIGIVSGIYQD